MDHAKYPPSSFPMIHACPQYKRREGDRVNLQRGRLLHKAVETILHDLHTDNVPEECTPDEIANASWAARWIREHTSSHRMVEEKVDIELDFEPFTWGTADVIDPPVLSGDNILTVVDVKNGRLSKSYDPQVMAYALGAMQRFGVENAHCVLLFAASKEILELDFNEEECEKILREVKGFIENKEMLGPVPCEFCDWCADQLTCPILAQEAVHVATEYEPTFQLDTYHSSEITDPNQMARALQLADILGKFASSVKSHATEAAMNGMVIPGYELKEGRSNRSVEDIAAAYKASGMDPNTFLQCCKMSVPQFEKLVASEMELKSVTKKVKNEVNARLGALVETVSGKPYLTKARKKKEDN